MEKFQIRIVRVNGNYANTDRINSLLSSIEKCKQVIELLELEDWEILKGEADSDNRGLGFHEEVVERSPRYAALLLKDQDDRAEWLKKQNEKTARINQLPKVFQSNLCLPVDLTYTRSQAEFIPSRSSSIQWYVSVKLGDQDRNFFPGDYVTKTGQIQVKKFAYDMPRLFGEKKNSVRPEIIRDIVREWKNIKTKIQNA